MFLSEPFLFYPPVLLTSKGMSEGIYCNARGKISDILNRFLHEAL
jgi:hypothetical protein